MHGVEAEPLSCPAIDGIIKEAKEGGDEADKQVLGAALIAAAQAIEP